MTRYVVLTAILVLAFGVTTRSALCDAGLEPSYYTDKGVTLEGTGILVACGFGSVTLDAKAVLRVKGAGTLTIPSGAEYFLDGEQWQTVVHSTSVDISGRGYAWVRVTNPDHDNPVKLTNAYAILEARGQGKAVLEGRGFFRTAGWKLTIGSAK